MNKYFKTYLNEWYLLFPHEIPPTEKEPIPFEFLVNNIDKIHQGYIESFHINEYSSKHPVHDHNFNQYFHQLKSIKYQFLKTYFALQYKIIKDIQRNKATVLLYIKSDLQDIPELVRYITK